MSKDKRSLVGFIVSRVVYAAAAILIIVMAFWLVRPR